MSALRFILIGGFLGAGKTTTIARLARAYRQQGLNVGIITNDEAAHLVDTQNLRSQGFEVGEVAGACFCCRFNELARVLESLETRQHPDVVLAEPIGSAADLVATVIQPLRELYGDKTEIAPHAVILKPSHGRKILRNERKAGVSPQAAYIFRKQLFGADVILINRIDQMTIAEADEVEELARAEHPGVPVLRFSAVTGEGFETVLETLEQTGTFGKRIVNIDYNRYGEAEAELGWFNGQFRITASHSFSLDSLVFEVLDQLRKSLAQIGAETAHTKALAESEASCSVANLTSSETPVEWSARSQHMTKTANLLINARVELSPELLQNHIERAVRETCSALRAGVTVIHKRSMRPSKPVPTHRVPKSLE